MILKGKYNLATVHTDNIDNATISQIIELCNQESMKDSKIEIMPDCHAGKGCVVGTTMTISDKVVPNLVGVDIGCGLASIKIDDTLDLERLDTVIREHIPYGFNTHKESKEKLLREVFHIDLRRLKCKVDTDRAFKSQLSLGSGNHFIEVDENKYGENYLVVHTGSRNLGKTIAEYYQNKAIEYCTEKYRNKKLDLIKELKEQGKESEIEEVLKVQGGLTKPSDDLCYLEGTLLDDYLFDMNIAQKYAAANRVSILAEILRRYYSKEEDLGFYCRKVKLSVLECIHNYIDIENKILRKGAISANKDEVVLIPINMRDGIILAKGKGNAEWNYSAPHGAGRVLSRSKAKNAISLEEFKESMEGIFTTCVGQSTLDEAPQAYKPMEEIMECIQDTVEVIEVIRPIYNFKAN